MKWKLVTPVALALLSSTNAQTSDVFVFNQCECVEKEFAAIGGNFISALAEPVSGNVEDFGCVDEDATGFPSDAGVTFETDPANSAITVTASSDLFNTGGARSTFYSAGKVSFVAGDNFDVEVFSVAGYVFRVRKSGVEVDGFFNLGGGSLASTDLIVADGDAVEVTYCIGDLEINRNFFLCVDYGTPDGQLCRLGTFEDTFPAVENDVNINFLFTRSAAAGDITTLTGEFLEFGKDLVANGASLADAEAACLALTTPSVDAIPNVNNLDFTTDEDNAVDLDLAGRLVGGSIGAGNLDFTVNQGALSGVFDPVDISAESIFNFDPDLNSNGDFEFSFTYSTQVGAALVCSNTADFTLSIAPVNDDPEVNDQNIDVFATVEQRLENFVVATDVDLENEVLVDGTFTVDALPAGIVTDCNGGTLIVTSDLTISNGRVSVCYTPDVTVVDDVTETLAFTVSDGVGGATSGTITYNGGNPISAVSPTLPGVEDENRAISMNDLGSGENNLDFRVRITRLPDPSVGRLVLIDESTAVEIGNEFDDDKDIVFIPKEDVFNSDTNTNVDISFGYEVFRLFGDDELTDEDGVGSLLIAATDDGIAEVTAVGASEIEVNGNGNGEVEAPQISIVSDDGNDVFDVELLITAGGGAFFLVNGNNLDLSGGERGTDENINCLQQACDRVIITARPSRLERAVRELDITVPLSAAEQDAFTINFAVASPVDNIDINTLTPIRFDINVNNDPVGFFDKTENILIVGGTGAGSLLVVTLFFIYRNTRARQIGETNILAIAAGNVDKELRAKKKKEKRERKERTMQQENGGAQDSDRSAPTPKGGATDGDDEIFDWEKHIDEKTKETYFFNPKTGESRWDPPTVKNSL